MARRAAAYVRPIDHDGERLLACISTPVFAQVGREMKTGEVIHNPRPIKHSDRWLVDPNPLLEIGGAVDDPDFQLFRVVDAARLTNGHIVIANQGTHELRIYDEDGRHVRAVGREGEGPGEFRMMPALQVGVNDSIYLFDRDMQRITVLDDRGEHSRTERVLVLGGNTQHAGYFHNGRGYATTGNPLAPSSPGTIKRAEVQLVLFGPTLQSPEIIAMLPGEITATFEVRGDPGYRTAPFSPLVLHDIFGNCIYIMPGDDHGFKIYASDGQLIRSVRIEKERQSVTKEHIALWEEQMFNLFPREAHAMIRELAKVIPVPDSLPAFNSLVIDATGSVWLQEYAAPNGVSPRWAVFDPAGHLVTRVEMPVALEVYEIGTDYVLGKSENDLGEESVGLYRLHRDDERMPNPPAECREP